MPSSLSLLKRDIYAKIATSAFCSNVIFRIVRVQKKMKSHHECEDFSFFSFQKKSSSWAERIWHSVLEKARWNATYSAKWWVWEIGWWKNACMGTKVNNFHNYSRESKRATRAVENAAAAAGCSRYIER